MKTAFPYRQISELPTFEYGSLVGVKYQGGGEAEAKGTDKQQLSDKPPLIRCGETYSVDSSNLKTQLKVLC